MSDIPRPLDVLFRPRSVAIVGASRNPDSMSGVLMRNLQQSFNGPIYPVNPNAAEVGGLRAYSSIHEIVEPVDLVFIAVPASHATEAVEHCIERGVMNMVMITAGFSETGEAGRKREERLRELVRKHGLLLIGPNCMGVMNTDPANSFNGSFARVPPRPGNVAVCTQSGALGFLTPDYMRQWNVGISSFASIGNKIDVGENDLLRYWSDDPATNVIQLYLESFQNPVEFRKIASLIYRHKPIVALKSGRTETGRRAAGSHTAALASHDTAVDALFRQSGVIRAKSLQELFEVTAVLSCQPVPHGRRVAVLSDAGGPAILCADALEAEGLQVPAFSPHLQKTLREFLPPEASVANPIDLIGTDNPSEFQSCLQHLLTANEVDSVIVIFVARLAHTAETVARLIRETAEEFAEDKTVVGVFMQSDGQPKELMAPDYGIPSFLYPENAAQALAAVVRYGERRGQPAGCVSSFEDVCFDAARDVIQQAQRDAAESGWLTPVQIGKLLEAFQLPTPATTFVRTADEAVAAFERIQSPVALKAIAPGALHKSDIGGLAIGLRDESSIRAAYHSITDSVEGISGVMVQEMVDGENEVMIGATRDQQFGAQISFGAGGVLVELLDDVSFRLAPLSNVDIDEMIQETKVGRVLIEGFRSFEPADVAAAKDLLARLSTMLQAFPEIEELDFNPVLLRRAGQGASIVDARIRVNRGQPTGRERI